MTQYRQWLKKNKVLFIIAAVILSVTFIAIYIVRETFISKEMLQSIIQAEITFLGFFALIATYLLTSYDTRIDRLKQQLFDSEEKKNADKIAEIKTEIENVEATKRDTAYASALVSLMIIISLLLSLLVFGMADLNSNNARWLSFAGLTFFFVSIFSLIFMFMRIATKPEEIKIL
jgi:hypothetical protein